MLGDRGNLAWCDFLAVVMEVIMSSVKARLHALESEVAILRQHIVRDTNWITRVSGSLKDYPEFDDVLRLGCEARERDNPHESTDGC